MRRLWWALRRRDLRLKPENLPAFVKMIPFGQAFCGDGLFELGKANSRLADLVGRETAYKAYIEGCIFWPIRMERPVAQLGERFLRLGCGGSHVAVLLLVSSEWLQCLPAQPKES